MPNDDQYGEPLPGRYPGPGHHPIPSGSTRGPDPVPPTDGEAEAPDGELPLGDEKPAKPSTRITD